MTGVSSFNDLMSGKARKTALGQTSLFVNSTLALWPKLHLMRQRVACNIRKQNKIRRNSRRKFGVVRCLYTVEIAV
jgi:hypothetical protein